MDDEDVVLKFLQYRSPKKVAEVLNIEEREVNLALANNKEKVIKIIDDLEQAEIFFDGDGVVDEQKVIAQLSAVTLRFFKERNMGMEPQEFLNTVDTIRKLLEANFKFKGTGDKHLHLHGTMADRLVEEFMEGKKTIDVKDGI